MHTYFKHIKRDFSQWSIYTLAIGLFIAIPLLAIVVYLFYGVGEMWGHVTTYFLKDYIINSLILLFGTGILCFFIGTANAWIISNYNFPGRKLAEWLLFLPLAIPSYIVAYTYVGLLGNGGSLVLLFQSSGLPIQKVEMMNIYGLIWVLSFSLFPYVYASARAVFKSYPKEVRETANLLKASNQKYFWGIALPMALPAITGGLFLVLMEVLNDYGAAKYYGVNTFTTGIFRTWTALEDLQSAIYLSAILVLLVLLLAGLARWHRGKKSFTLKMNFARNKHQQKKTLRGFKKILYLSIIWGTILMGFALPFSQLLYWAALTFESIFDLQLFQVALQSIGVALLATLFILINALAIIYFSRWNRIKTFNIFPGIATIGYVIPGAIIGIGILRSSQSIVNFASSAFDLKIGYLFYSSSFVLIYAYIFRFIAIAYNLIGASSLKLGKCLTESAYLLGLGKLSALFRIELPLIKRTLVSAFLLVFIDIMKELPLTLILKPYNLQTLAVKAYAFADDERVAEAALPSLLLIIIIGLLMIVLNHREKKETEALGRNEQISIQKA